MYDKWTFKYNHIKITKKWSNSRKVWNVQVRLWITNFFTNRNKFDTINRLFVEYFFDSLVFLICFILLRQCTGGYHSKTYLSCSLSFITVYLIFIYYRNYIMFSYEGLIISGIISLVIIFILAPMEHKNKKMNKEKKNTTQNYE